MKKSLILSILAAASVIPAFAEGIKFMDITVPEALAIAKKENKRVFVDCYTPTCTPCKYMAVKVFPLDPCGEFMNPDYVSVAKDLDAEDNRYLRKQYGVMVFPTFLILNPDGSLFYKLEGGATKTADEFIEKMKSAVKNGEMNARYAAGERTPQFMDEYTDLLATQSKQRLGTVIDEYLQSLSDEQICDPTNLRIAGKITSANSKGFTRIFDSRDNLSKSVGKDRLAQLFNSIFNADYSANSRMKMKFDTRIQQITQLEKEQLMSPSLLRSKYLFRQVISYRDKTRIPEVIEAVKEIRASSFPQPEKEGALQELTGIEELLTPEQRQLLLNN